VGEQRLDGLAAAVDEVDDAVDTLDRFRTLVD
jgi:hypothetical protein